MSIFDFKKTDKKKEPAKKKAAVKSAPVSKEPKKQPVKDLYKNNTSVDKKNTSVDYKNAYKVLVKPLITEKASILGAQDKYLFAVTKEANKIEVAKAVKQVYGVTPKNVNIIRVSGKKVRTGRTLGKRKDWKKAIVTLPKGQSIKIYEGV